MIIGLLVLMLLALALILFSKPQNTTKPDKWLIAYHAEVSLRENRAEEFVKELDPKFYRDYINRFGVIGGPMGIVWEYLKSPSFPYSEETCSTNPKS